MGHLHHPGSPVGTAEPTARLDLVASAQVARLTAKEFDVERAKMVKACSNCHSENFAKEELAKGDALIERIDHLMAFHDAPTPIENRLFLMHLKHRMRAFQGAFHMNPDYTLWYGWNDMVMDLDEIRYMAKEMRTHHK